MKSFVTTLLFALASMLPTQAALALDDVPDFPNVSMDRSLEWENQKGPRTDWQDQQLSRQGYSPCTGDQRVEEGLGNQWQNLAASEHYDEAIKVLTKLITLHQSEPGPYISRAKLYLKMGKPQEAKNDLTVVVSIDRLASGPVIPAVKLLFKLDEYELAESALERSIAKDPGSGDLNYRAQRKYYCALAQEHLKKPQEAIENYLSAGTDFMAAGLTDPGNLCLKRINEISTAGGPTAKVHSVKDFHRPTKNLPKIIRLVKELSSRKAEFSPEFVHAITGATMISSPNGREYFGKIATSPSSPPATHFEGLQLVMLNYNSVTSIGIHTNRTACCAERTDFTDLLKNFKRINPPPPFEKIEAYSVPKGTLIMEYCDGGFKALAGVTLYGPKAELPWERPTFDQRLGLSEFDGGLRMIELRMDSFWDQGKFEDAIKFTQRWTEAKPNELIALQYHAMALQKAGKYAQAIKDFNSVIERDAHWDPSVPRHVWFQSKYRGNILLIQRGTCWLDSGNFKEALQDFKLGFPEKLNADDYYWRGKAELGIGQVDDASRDLQQAVDSYYKEARIVRRDEAQQLLNTGRTKAHPAPS